MRMIWKLSVAKAKFVALWIFQIIYSFINIFWDLCFLDLFSTLAQNQLEKFFWVGGKKKKKVLSAWRRLLEILAILCVVLPWRRVCLCVCFSPSVPGNIGVGDALDCDQLWNTWQNWQTMYLTMCTAPVVMLRPHLHTMHWWTLSSCYLYFSLYVMVASLYLLIIRYKTNYAVIIWPGPYWPYCQRAI